MSRPFRYTFILALVAVGTALAAFGGWRFARASAPVSGPIVLISIDALRYDRLPAYGYAAGRTPAIDALAEDGVLFERAYSHVPQTLPAHAALLTGRLPFQNGVRDNLGFVLPPSERLVAEMLRDRGFSTAAVVSSYALRQSTGIAQGFAFFDDPSTTEEGSTEDPLSSAIARDGMETVALAERWLGSAGTERAFLFLHLQEPHWPDDPPAAYSDLAPYDAEVAYVDAAVGRFVQYLKSHQLYDQATIILVADHGEGLGSHGEQEHGLFLYEEAIRVPLIVKPPAGEGAGRRVRTPVQHVDLVPTILDLAKAPVPDNLAGRSLEPLLDGERDFPDRPIYAESLYARYHLGWSGLAAVTDGRYRYIRAPEEELYDLDADPGETLNLARARGPEVARLRAVLEQMVSGPALPEPAAALPQDRERLALLGTVGRRLREPLDPDPALPDPKDKRALLNPYRAAVRHAAAGEWAQAIGLLRGILDADEHWAGAWAELGAVTSRAGRLTESADAYRRAAALRPGDAALPLAAADVMLRLRRLDEAKRLAEFALTLSPETEPALRVAAYEELARIALARRDPVEARAAARQARELEPNRPLPEFIEGRLLYDLERYADAVEPFEAAVALIEKAQGRPLADLRFYTAEALVRAARPLEAEAHLLREIESFTHHVRARGSLASLYYTTGRPELAAEVVAELTRLYPTPDAYNLAARLWESFGNPRRAAAVRAEALRALAPAAPRSASPAEPR